MIFMKCRRIGIALLAVALLGAASQLPEVNVDDGGLALRGYDPVSYFEGGKPAHGAEAISASYGGARYLFASEAHRTAFLADPARYLPQFGGFCAVGASFGEKVDTDPETGKVVNGKLYLNYNAKAQAIFDKDTPGTIVRAEENWPKIKDQSAK